MRLLPYRPGNLLLEKMPRPPGIVLKFFHSRKRKGGIFGRSDSDMPLSKLLKSYQNQINDESIFLRVMYEVPTIFLEFRKQNGPLLSPEDEHFLIEILKDDEWKWFATHVISGIKDFGEPLMHQLVQTAVLVDEIFLGDDFILPCLRVYDVFPVIDLLVEFLQYGSPKEKRGAACAFYYARPRLAWTRSRKFWSEKWILKGYHHSFDDEKISWRGLGSEPPMSPEELQAYLPRVKAMVYKREKALLRAFFENDAPELRHYISLRLPKSLASFSDGLENDAKRYFTMVDGMSAPG